MNNQPANTPQKLFTTRLIVSAGLLVGILDGIAAIISYLVKGGKHPEKIFHFIASAVFGSTALKGGTDMLIAGITFHLLIAMIWTIIFFWAYANIKTLRTCWILTGIGYGAMVWAIMTQLIVPLSKAPAIPFNWKQAVIGMLIIIVAIGLPLAAIAANQSKRNKIQ
ncbi:MAG: hypothetical protein IPP99_16410 [Chitinophagaceae bacterium]|nr:hypothetical protein [Chitinophagaceae bacterium]